MRIILAVLLLSASASAQISSGTLFGEVRDGSSALVPGARITARSTANGFQRETATNELGAYRLDELLPGEYIVSAAKEGFQTASATNVRVEVSQRARLALTLTPGDSRQTLDVSASVSPLETDDATQGARLQSTTAASLPLVGRNVISLMSVGPGAAPRQLGGFYHDTINDVQGNRGAVELNHPVNGARSTMNAYYLDGASSTDRNTYSVSVIPPMDSVLELRVVSSLAPAEFGVAGGGVMDLVTRSGSSQWHGSAYEYLRNEATDARGFFDDPSLPRPIFRQNQFGGSLGGPLVPSSTFFFTAYDGLRGQSATSTLHLFPNAALRSGDFANRAAIFDPLTLDTSGRRRPFASGQIPTSRINGAARKYVDQYLPLPNRPEGDSNYLDSTPNRHENDAGIARIDHQFRDRGSLFGRYTINDERGRLAGAFPERPSLENLRAQQGALGYTRSGRNWVQETRLAFTRLRVFNIPESAFQTNVLADLGISGFGDDPFYYGLPYFVVSNFQTVTDATTLPQVQRDNTWYLSESLSWSRGRHNWKAGFQWTGFQLNYLQSRFPRGLYQFSGTFTGDPLSPESTGDAFADFMLGYPQSTQRNVGDAIAYLRQNIFGGYIQDDWHATSSLTFNLGLRYEYFSPYTERRGHLLNLDYSTLPKPPIPTPVHTAVDPDRNDFAPRVGLAWRLPPIYGRDSRMVIRAGYGIYASPEIALETYDLIRNGLSSQNNQTNSLEPTLTIENGFPSNSSLGLPAYFGLTRRSRTPYVQQWNFGAERELPGRVVFETSYLGSKGVHLGRFRRFNTALHTETGENLDPRPGDLQSLRTFPSLGPIIQREHIANSTYHSLQLRGEKRFAKGLSFIAGFAWSKSIDDADASTVGLYDSFGAQDERNLRLERALSFFDIRRRVSLALTYNTRGVNRWTRDWQLSTLATFQDGMPLNPVYFIVDNANTGTPNRPDIVAGQKASLPPDERSIDRYFNTDAFTMPAPYTFGNAGRNTLPGPGNAVVDASIQRSFRIGDRVLLSPRAEAFNVLNHPNIGIPVPNPDFGPFFGRIVTSGNPRRFQFALRLDF